MPVVRDSHGDYYGVDAVIDKDFASACLAEAVGADYLFILTAVDHVCLNFGTPEQRALDELHVDEAETYLREGQFGAGSMQPKVAAAVQFVRSGWRRRAVIACSSRPRPPCAARAARASCRKIGNENPAFPKRERPVFQPGSSKIAISAKAPASFCTICLGLRLLRARPRRSECRPWSMMMATK